MINSKFDILINPFTLNFKDKSLEKEFRAYSIESVKKIVRIATLLGLTAFFIIVLASLLTNSQSLFLFDGVLIVASGIVFYLFTFSKYYSKYYLIVLSIIYVVGCVGMIYSLHGYDKIFIFIHLRILFFTLIPFVTILFSVLSSSIIITSILLTPLFFSDTTFSQALDDTLSIFPYFMLITLALYLKQRYERAIFFKRKQLIEKNKMLEADFVKLELQSAIGLILQESTQIDLNLNEFLDNTLEIILELSWMKVLNKGSIFLTNNDGDLEMVVSKNLGVLTKTCALVKAGQCLCGKALQDKELLFNNCVTDDHTIRPEGMSPHGHYNVPLLLNDNVLGVLNIYVEHGHKKTDEEEYFFLLVADTLASVIYRHQLEKDKTKQAEIIKSSHQKIKSSIEYAQRIQQSLLSSSLTVKDKFKDIVLKYIPKEIVSGDFYFAKEKNDCIYLAVADCTGHGVPGALVSTLGIQELFHIIDSGIKDSGEILNALNNKINFLLNNDDEIGSDGMDIILLCVDQKNNLIHYSGAKGLFYMYQNNELIRYKTDSFSIGSKADEDFKFNTKTIEYKDNDTVYLLTDGIIDQISKVNNKRIGSKRVKQLMQKMNQANLKQKIDLFDDFMTTHQSKSQIDDITFITFKL